MDTERLDRLDALIRENRIIRGQWTQGHDRACLLAALAPEAGQAQSASACPAEVVPEWLAHLTVFLDDATSREAWPALVRRYAALARRWHVLDTAAWERARIGALISILIEARQHCTQHETTLVAIDKVIDWLRRGAPESERSPTREVAVAAAGPQQSKAQAEAQAEAATAVAAAWSATAATAAVSAATAAESAARAAAWSATAAWSAARDAAADRIAASVLDAIDREIVAAEGRR